MQKNEVLTLTVDTFSSEAAGGSPRAARCRQKVLTAGKHATRKVPQTIASVRT